VVSGRRSSSHEAISWPLGVNLNDITPLILTYNEEANLARLLDSLRWAKQIVVVDSKSTDATRDIAMSFDRVRIVEREFDCHSNQWNFGLQQVETPWTLALDADYVGNNALSRELESLDFTGNAYAVGFVYAVGGKPLRGTLYPARVVLFRTEQFSYVQDGHTQSLDLKGATCQRLQSKITHDDRKPLGRWLKSQHNYAALEANKLLAADSGMLGWKDRVRRSIIWAPPLTLLYCLLYKGLLFDGWPGIYYSLQRTYAELLLSLELLDRRLRGRPAAQTTGQLAPATPVEEGLVR
jgi:hypothetical protein